MKRLISLSFLISLFALSTSQAGGPTPLPLPETTRIESTSAPNTTSFNAIDSIGHFNIIIQPSRIGGTSFTIDPADTNDQADGTIKGNTLYLRQPPSSQATTNVLVTMNLLTHLTVFNGGSVNANHLNTEGLIINTNTDGTINLKGNINLRNVFISGPTRLNLNTVSGNNVALYSNGDSIIYLTGHVHMMRIKLSHHTLLHARALKTQHTWVQTKDYAQAQITATQSLQAYPTQLSNIYYYKTPGIINRINSESGNTLQLGYE